MAISGSQKAYKYALSNILRSGASRSNYTSTQLFLSIGGVQVGCGKPSGSTAKVRDITITDTLNDAANTASFTAEGFTPTVGQDVIWTFGSINNLDRLFAGEVLSVNQTYVGSPLRPMFQVRCIDWTWGLNRRIVTAKYQNQTIGFIAQSLLTQFAPGYTLALTDTAFTNTILNEISFTNQDLPGALSQLVKRGGGYWYCDYAKALHLFQTESSLTAPAPLIGTHTTLFSVEFSQDLSQMATRALIEGGGATAMAAVLPGDTIIPVDTAVWYEDAGGVVVSGPQRITYTGRLAGGGGTLVGPGAAPTATIVATVQSGSGVTAGSHDYAVTFVTGSGESLAGPKTTAVVGLFPPPITALGLVSYGAGTGPDVGSHTYVMTHITASGETVAGPSATATTYTTQTVPPSFGPNAGNPITGVGMDAGTYYYAVSFVNAFGETTAGPLSNPVTIIGGGNPNNIVPLSGIPIGSAEVTARRIYRQLGQTPNLKLLQTLNNNTATTFTDSYSNATLGGSPPASNTAITPYRQPKFSLPLGPAGTTARGIYRSTANTTAPLLLIGSVNNNTDTQWIDTTVDASLLSTQPPATGTALANQVGISQIPAGPATVTQRKLYRTAAGQTQLKLLATLADNTTTTYTDTTADGSLGANAPVSDSSGLSQPQGAVLAGNTSIIVAGAGAFQNGGGWAVIGNGEQVIRYTGISGNTLTGIPASGVGAITATVNYNSTITQAPQITGVPASGTGAIVWQLKPGDSVDLFITVDDTAAQSLLASYVGGDGIQEQYDSDNRISAVEARARGQAILALRNHVSITVSYTVRDQNTRTGRMQEVNLPTPTNFSGSFIIQEVTISQFEPALLPVRSVRASTEIFSLENLIVQARRDQG